MVLPTIQTDPWLLYGRLLNEVKELLGIIKYKRSRGGLTDGEHEALMQARDDLIDLRTLLSAAVNAGNWQNQGAFREPSNAQIEIIKEVSRLVDAANRYDARVEAIVAAANALLSLAGELDAA